MRKYYASLVPQYIIAESARLATSISAAVVCVCHTNKGGKGTVMGLAGGERRAHARRAARHGVASVAWRRDGRACPDAM